MSTPVGTKYDARSLTVQDGTTPTALECLVRLDNADIALDGIMANMRETKPITSRGKLVCLVQGDVKFPTAKFSAKINALSSNTSATLWDFLFKRGDYEDRLSTSTSIGNADTINLMWETPGGGSLVMRDCVWETSFGEGDENTISAAVTIYGDIEVDGTVLVASPRVA